jgi:hypothetical protein
MKLALILAVLLFALPAHADLLDDIPECRSDDCEVV